MLGIRWGWRWKRRWRRLWWGIGVDEGMGGGREGGRMIDTLMMILRERLLTFSLSLRTVEIDCDNYAVGFCCSVPGG